MTGNQTSQTSKENFLADCLHAWWNADGLICSAIIVAGAVTAIIWPIFGVGILVDCLGFVILKGALNLVIFLPPSRSRMALATAMFLLSGGLIIIGTFRALTGYWFGGSYQYVDHGAGA
jgi:hypothetical protein